MDMSPPTLVELASYPHFFFTSDIEWNPQTFVDEYTVHDLEPTDNDYEYNEYHPDIIKVYAALIPAARQQDIHLRKQRQIQPDLEQLSLNFGFVPRLRIQHTLDHTTQLPRLDSRLPLRKHFTSRFPAANVIRLNAVVATDTYFFDTPALDFGLLGHGGTTMVQLFCGCKSLLTDLYPMRHEGNISGT
jgi:hypothetical protein